jgi:hypothetical protein
LAVIAVMFTVAALVSQGVLSDARHHPLAEEAV